MKLKRVISLVLLAVYLFAAGGSAYVALSCSCLSPHAHLHAGHEGCLCCGHAAAEDHADDHPVFLAPCCGHDHSTVVELYTGAEDRMPELRCAVVALPAMLAAECPCPAHVAALRGKPVERPLHFVEEPVPLQRSLRAPPVMG